MAEPPGLRHGILALMHLLQNLLSPPARGGGGDWLSPADVSSLKAVAQANADAVRHFITGRFFDMKDMAEPLSEADLHFDYSKSAVYPILSVPDPSTKASSV